MRHIHYLLSKSGALLVVQTLFLVAEAKACSAPTIIAPTSQSIISVSMPTIAWTQVDNVISYDISIVSRVPEGAIISQFNQTTTALSLTSNTALTQKRAVVSAQVQSKCTDGKTSSKAEVVFHIDVSNLCPTPESLSSSIKNGRRLISWSGKPEFIGVEGRLFSGLDAKPSEITFASVSPMITPTSDLSPKVFGIRAVCATSKSKWTWLAL